MSEWTEPGNFEQFAEIVAYTAWLPLLHVTQRSAAALGE